MARALTKMFRKQRKVAQRQRRKIFQFAATLERGAAGWLVTVNAPPGAQVYQCPTEDLAVRLVTLFTGRYPKPTERSP